MSFAFNDLHLGTKFGSGVETDETRFLVTIALIKFVGITKISFQIKILFFSFVTI